MAPSIALSLRLRILLPSLALEPLRLSPSGSTGDLAVSPRRELLIGSYFFNPLISLEVVLLWFRGSLPCFKLVKQFLFFFRKCLIFKDLFEIILVVKVIT